MVSFRSQKNKGGNTPKLPETKNSNTQIQTLEKTELAKRREEEGLNEKEKFDFYAFSYRLIGKKILFLYPRLIRLEKKIRESGMLTHYEAYISGMMFLMVLMGVVGVVVGVVMSLLLNLQPAILDSLLPFILGSTLSQVSFGFMWYYPNLQSKKRMSKIAGELPYYIGYMATLSASGLTLEGVFKAVATEESDEYITKDARHMIRNLELLGMDIITALKEIVERTPQSPYQELLEGLISTVESGGNMKEYFIATANVQMEEKKVMLKKMTASLGIVAELYTILLIVFPLLSIIMLSIMAIMTPTLAGMSLMTLIQMLTYMFVPLLGVMMLIMIDAMVPKR